MKGRYQGLPRDDNIFVVGCQRSGTSAVYAGLIAHPELKPLRPFDRATAGFRDRAITRRRAGCRPADRGRKWVVRRPAAEHRSAIHG